MTEHKPLIEPIPREILESELNPDRFIRKTNKGDNEIYIVNQHNSPNTMREIGRLRELTFRSSGGGTGKEIDVDKYDLGSNCYDQLLVYNKEEKEIIGGYRFKDGGKCINASTGEIELSTASYFTFSKVFLEKYLPYTIELGRSWVQPSYQPAVNPRKGIFALDNIWDGLGALSIDNPHIKYFFGKVTMYKHYNKEARDMILFFLRHFFPDRENLLEPFDQIPIQTSKSMLASIFKGLDFKEGFKILNHNVRELGENIPPLVNIYMNLSPTMKTFGTATNPHFGDVEETGIMVTINDIYADKRERHVNSYVPKNRKS
jgi:Acetyltransferase (GNAT) domain